MSLYHKAWEKSREHDRDAVPADIMNGLKTAIGKIRSIFEGVKNFHIPHARGGGYTCKGNFKFCIVLKKSSDQWYSLEKV